MNRLTRTSATVVSSLALVAGFATIAGAAPASIDRTGSGSNNVVRRTATQRTRVVNTNDARVTTNNPQTASTGHATADGNTTGGSVLSGTADNASDTLVTVAVDNTSAAAEAVGGGAGAAEVEVDGTASISQTGANSNNEVIEESTVRTRVRNDNTVRVETNNTQSATSGHATATNNTTVGTVRTGDASNSNLTTVEVSLTN